jgi:uncharacterized protein (DUF885 family)
MTLRLCLLGTAAAALTACATVSPVAPSAPPAALPAEAPPAPAATAESEHAKLFALFARSDEASLERNPMSAIYRGDLRFADRLGDNITDAYYAAEKAALERDLAELRTVNRTALSEVDQLAFDVFEYQATDSLKGFAPEYLSLNVVRPMNHFYGLHKDYATFASGQGGAPFKTVLDYDNNLKRHADFVAYVDRAIGRWRQGQAAGVLDTKLTVRNMIEQLGNQLKFKPEDSPLFRPVKTFPAAIGAADRARLTAEYRTAITGRIYPALTRMRDFLRDEYLPQARDSVGLSQMKGGAALYRQMVKSTTTLPLEPEAIHELGLSEVERITRGFEEVRKEVGFKGTLPQFFDHMRTAKRFQPKSREALTADYYRIGKAVDAKIPTYFSTVPKSPLVIRPYEPFREKFEAGGSYEGGTPDGSRPGTFYFNAYDLPTRSTWGETTLFLHEGAPGHHFQISLAQENDALPSFMRFGGNTAYVEGWALYSETLGYDMGFYQDPYQRFGTLGDEMLRAMRLVVDTGLHTKGWTRDQAIAYMLGHSGMGRPDATAEVERYIAIPSQALAYKIGALTIQRLRDHAKAELGDKFDIRDFHAQVLMTGALPLTILEAKINRWIAAKKAG